MLSSFKIFTDKLGLKKGDSISILSFGRKFTEYFVVEHENSQKDVFNIYTSQRLNLQPFDEVVAVGWHIFKGILGNKGFFYDDGKLCWAGNREDEYIALTYIKTKNPSTGLYGVYNYETKTQIIEESYEEIEYKGMYDSLFFVRKGERCGVLNHAGIAIIPVEYPKMALKDYEGFWPVKMQDGKYLLYTREGKKIVNHTILYKRHLNNIIINDGGKYYIYRNDGTPLLDKPCKEITYDGVGECYNVILEGKEKKIKYWFFSN